MYSNRNIVTLTVAILGAVKLILQAYGVQVINDQQIDAIANGLAAVITVVGVLLTHTKRPPGPGSVPSSVK